MPTPEPRYEVLDRTDAFEIRRYAAVLVAETPATSGDPRGSNAAFSVLAAFIFGKNRARRGDTPAQKIAMTAPVNLDANGAAPVLQFFLPPELDEQSVPEPLDARVHVRRVPLRTVAVHRYRGRWTDALFRQKATALTAALQSSRWRARSEPILARYDPPWTPWFLRRNEVWIEVDAR